MAESKVFARTRVKPGTRVRLSGAFLRATGQYTGGDRIYTVADCDCALCANGRFIAVDEPSALHPSSLRHFAEANTVMLGKPSVRNIG